jgi:hypothetical protein
MRSIITATFCFTAIAAVLPSSTGTSCSPAVQSGVASIKLSMQLAGNVLTDLNTVKQLETAQNCSRESVQNAIWTMLTDYSKNIQQIQTTISILPRNNAAQTGLQQVLARYTIPS